MTVAPVDLLALGPHPDDIEIGLGGIVAMHAAFGHRVGLCDLTAGEMGSNGTVEGRLAEAEAARAVLGAAWRVNLRLPDRALGSDLAHVRAVASLVRAARPHVVAAPYWADRHPDHVSASQLITEAVFSAGLRRYPADGDAWKVRRLCYYFINDSATPSFVVDVSAQYSASSGRSPATSRSSRPPTLTRSRRG
jgi:bacillithiol biosynthesis deacetylase BshB1